MTAPEGLPLMCPFLPTAWQGRGGGVAAVSRLVDPEGPGDRSSEKLPSQGHHRASVPGLASDLRVLPERNKLPCSLSRLFWLFLLL